MLSIWSEHLKQHLASLEQVLAKVSLSSGSGKHSLPGLEPERMLSPALKLEISRQAEALSTIHAIKELRESSLPPPHLLVSVYYTLALLYTVIRQLEKVNSCTA